MLISNVEYNSIGKKKLKKGPFSNVAGHNALSALTISDKPKPIAREQAADSHNYEDYMRPVTSLPVKPKPG